MAKQKACKTCHTIVEDGNPCPVCKTHNTLSPHFSGQVIIIDSEKSQIAKRLNTDRPGTYAIRVR